MRFLHTLQLEQVARYAHALAGRNPMLHVPMLQVPALHVSDSAPIPLSVPHLSSDAALHMAEALAQNWVAHVGPSVDLFERELAALVGVPTSFATHSGTAALHLALKLCDVQRGDTVFCSALTFVASANPILYEGAEPVFIDCEPGTWGMSRAALARALARSHAEKRLPKALIVAHLYGHAASLPELIALADSYGVPVIEDAAQALGACHDGRACGTLGRIGVYSFAGNKMITTSAGGALVSNDASLVARARFLGLQARDPAQPSQHLELGFNYRLSNVLAALGRSQLPVLWDRVAARRAVYTRYRRALADLDQIAFVEDDAHSVSTRWLSVLLLPVASSLTPDALVAALGERQIEARRVFQPLHTQPFLKGAPFYAHGDVAECEALFARGVCLPSSSSLTEAQQERVISALRQVLAGAFAQSRALSTKPSASRTISATPSNDAYSALNAAARRA